MSVLVNTRYAEALAEAGVLRIPYIVKITLRGEAGGLYKIFIILCGDVVWNVNLSGMHDEKQTTFGGSAGDTNSVRWIPIQNHLFTTIYLSPSVPTPRLRQMGHPRDLVERDICRHEPPLPPYSLTSLFLITAFLNISTCDRCALDSGLIALFEVICAHLCGKPRVLMLLRQSPFRHLCT